MEVLCLTKAATPSTCFSPIRQFSQYGVRALRTESRHLHLIQMLSSSLNLQQQRASYCPAVDLRHSGQGREPRAMYSTGKTIPTTISSRLVLAAVVTPP